jgi:hypothetical protein
MHSAAVGQTDLEDLDNSSCKGSWVGRHDNVALAGFHIDASKGWLLLLSAHNTLSLLCVEYGCCCVGLLSAVKQGCEQVISSG